MPGELQKRSIYPKSVTQLGFNITAASRKPSLSLSSSCQSRFAVGKRGEGDSWLRYAARGRSVMESGAFCYTPTAPTLAETATALTASAAHGSILSPSPSHIVITLARSHFGRQS